MGNIIRHLNGGDEMLNIKKQRELDKEYVNVMINLAEEYRRTKDPEERKLISKIAVLWRR
jgi:uncharacterized protein (UPF0305 family)